MGATACKGAEAFSASDEKALTTQEVADLDAALSRARARRGIGDDGKTLPGASRAVTPGRVSFSDESTQAATGPWATAPVPKGSLAWSTTRHALASIVPQFSQCESVAEQMFLLGMVVPSEVRLVVLSPPLLPLIRATDGRCLELVAQHSVGGRRLDFVLRGNGHRCVAIEVDGFAYHERTQEQAEADRARDREMLAAGVVTVRFMAKAVFADPSGCADEAFALALGECRPENVGQVLAEGFSR